MQISNVIFVEEKNIYIGIVLEKISLVDNKAKILHYLT